MGRHNDEPLCLQCHSGQGALAAWGVTSAYKEMNAVNEGITCAVCHDPHDATNPGQLRYPISSTDLSKQLCMKCHNRRSVPIAMDSTRAEEDPQGKSGSNSPHAPQGPVLLAAAGYQNLTYLDPSVVQPSSHGQLAKNPKLCAGCHLYGFPTTNDAGQAVTVTGHLLPPDPLLRAGWPAHGLDQDLRLHPGGALVQVMRSRGLPRRRSHGGRAAFGHAQPDPESDGGAVGELGRRCR